jgi:hypothetical protein
LRRQATITALEKRVNLLENAVEEMSKEFVGLGDRLLQSSQVTRNPPLLDDLRGTMRRFLDIVQTTDRGNDEEESSEPADTAQQHDSSESSKGPMEMAIVTPATAGGTLPNALPNVPSVVAELPIFFAQPNELIGPATLDIIQLETLGRFSPRLSYGLLGGSFPTLENVSTIYNMDYLIGGLNSFATRLFFDTVDMVWRAMAGELHMPGFIASACRYRLRHDRPDILRMLCYHKATQLRNEGVTVDRGGLDSDPETMELAQNAFTPQDYARLKHAIIGCVSELLQDGSSPDEWLDPWSTYRYIGTKWGLKLTSSVILVPSKALRSFSASQSQDTIMDLSTTEDSCFSTQRLSVDTNTSTMDFSQHGQNAMASALSESENYSQSQHRQNTVPAMPMKFGDEQPDVIVNAQRLLQKLALDMICLGDGPRYAKPHIDAAVQSFLGEVSGIPITV